MPRTTKSATSNTFEELVMSASQTTIPPLNKNTALKYFKDAYPVSTACSEIDKRLKLLQPILDGNSKKLQKIQELLQNPHPFFSFKKLQEIYVINHCIFGEQYVILKGVTDTQIVELVLASKVTVEEGTDGFPMKFTVTNGSLERRFERTPDNKFLCNDGSELFYSFTSNGNSHTNGLSPLSSINKQLYLYMGALEQNSSRIEQGVKPDLVITPRDSVSVLNEEQYTPIMDAIRTFYTGAKNAGKALFLPANVSVESFSSQSVDMDFKELTNMTRNAVFNKLGIPATAFDTSATTFSNRSIDELAMYDNTIIPIFNEMMDFLLSSIAKNMNIKDEISATFDTAGVPALYSRKLNQMKLKSIVGCYTINELRAEDNKEERDDGDIIPAPSFKPDERIKPTENETSIDAQSTTD